MRPCMWSACSLMTRKNCRTSAGPRARKVPSTVEVEPLIEISGVRSSWLTRLRNWALCRSSSSRGSRSCIVTTTDTTSPAAPRLGVALTSVLTLRPSGTESTISSARTVSALLSCCASGNPRRETSRPSFRRTVILSSSCSTEQSGVRRPSTIRVASRLSDARAPVFASKTATPIGDVSTRASTSARTRCSSR